jgi:hypothetical protein
MKPSVLIAAGCSWVAGRAIDTDPVTTDYDYDHVEDPNFVQQHSFAGILQKKLGLDNFIMLARNGTNNEQQVHSIVDWITDNADQYSKLFLLFGITSTHRWQMYSSTAKEVIPCALGMSGKNNPELAEEFKYYTKHFLSNELEVSRLSVSLRMLDGYLNNLKIDHLFVNSFQSYSFDSSFADYYRVNEQKNDLLNFLCETNDIHVPRTSFPFLNLFGKGKHQYLTEEIIALQNIGMLDRATAHPTAKAHQLIADELYSYIRNNKNERI